MLKNVKLLYAAKFKDFVRLQSYLNVAHHKSLVTTPLNNRSQHREVTHMAALDIGTQKSSSSRIVHQSAQQHRLKDIWQQSI